MSGLIVKTPQTEALKAGDAAYKVGGSYQASGTIVSAFKTKAGELRYVFEFDNPAGMLHIFGPTQVIKTVMPKKASIPPMPDGRGYSGGDELRASCNQLTHKVIYNMNTMQHEVVKLSFGSQYDAAVTGLPKGF